MIVCNQVMKYILDRIDKDERQAAKRKKKEEVVEAKRRLANASKLSSLLYRHKESLKMEILKKRALLDKELQLEAQVWRLGGQDENNSIQICPCKYYSAFDHKII